jgi:hypothetical protein
MEAMEFGIRKVGKEECYKERRMREDGRGMTEDKDGMVG